jgi:hypothetical protein
LKVLRESESWQAIVIALFDSLMCSVSTNSATKFDRSQSNSHLAFADDNRSATRPGSVSSYPLARAPITRGPGFKPGQPRSFSVCLERAPNVSNSTSFGVAAKSIRTEGSDGIGPTSNSWGVICSFGSANAPTKVVASGKQVATWRMLEEGDVLRAQYFPDGRLIISLNLFECEHCFDLPAEVVANFGSASSADDDQYTFAMTIATDHCIKICL